MIPSPEDILLVPKWEGKLKEYGRGVAFSSDGSLLAGFDARGWISLFAEDTGEVLQTWEAHQGGITTFAFHPTKPLLATAGEDGLARIFTLQSLSTEPIATLPGDDLWMEDLCWSPRGDVLLTASGRVVKKWTPGGTLKGSTEKHKSTVTGIAFNRRGDYFCTSSYGGIQIFSTARMNSTRHLEWKGSLFKPLWSPDQEIIAAGCQDNSVHFWRVKTGVDSEMSGYPRKPELLAIDDRTTLLATSGGRSVLAWPFFEGGPEGKAPFEMPLHEDFVSALAFQPRSTLLASGARDGSLVLWDPLKNSFPSGLGVHPGAITGLSFHPRGRSFASCDDQGNLSCWVL